MSSDYINGVSASHCGVRCKFNFRAVLAAFTGELFLC